VTSGHNIRILDDSVARKIAAGEVIERPHSLVRELLDNALDAEADQIEVYLESGGLQSVRVVDNGFGMSREDLEICFLPHATSKIAREADLEQLESLGFRGEALTSIASVAKLDIVSKQRDAEMAHRLLAENGKLVALEPYRGTDGTTVAVSDLFYNMPARKRFLKRPGAETGMSKSVFIEKALPFPDRTFRLYTDGSLKLFLPASPTTERVAACFPDHLEEQLLYEVSGTGDGFSFTAIVGAPDLARRDRKMIQVFVNNRRIWEYSLVQAVEYAFEEILHGGIHPTAFLFLQIDPHLVDFNVHPAKREARFHNLREVHSRVVRVLREFLSGFARRAAHAPSQEPSAGIEPAQPHQQDLNEQWHPGETGGRPAAAHTAQGSFHPQGRRSVPDRRTPLNADQPSGQPRQQADRDFGLEISRAARDCDQVAEKPAPNGVAAGVRVEGALEGSTGGGGAVEGSIRYIGQLFGLFLLAEYNGVLYLVDQHAGHERVLYEKLCAEPSSQSLLIPETFEPDPDAEATLRENLDGLAQLGVRFEEREPGTWALTAVPAGCQSDTQSVIDTATSRSLPESDLSRRFFAIVACKAAIKDGETVDEITAQKLLEEVFALPDARCPHGRPIWHELSQEELLQYVGRT
jgi:DNA mismatch repair protein MutL